MTLSPRLQQFIPVFPVVSSTVTLFNNAYARDYMRRNSFDVSEVLLGLLVLALISLAVFYFLKSRRVSDAARPFITAPLKAATPDSALQILRERLAKGEIDPEDYDLRKRLLTDHNELS
jgi:uncharacterized membrane protein